jgi:hypothetical protein
VGGQSGFNVPTSLPTVVCSDLGFNVPAPATSPTSVSHSSGSFIFHQSVLDLGHGSADHSENLSGCQGGYADFSENLSGCQGAYRKVVVEGLSPMSFLSGMSTSVDVSIDPFSGRSDPDRLWSGAVFRA